jgi:hypothetical protein
MTMMTAAQSQKVKTIHLPVLVLIRLLDSNVESSNMADLKSRVGVLSL